MADLAQLASWLLGFSLLFGVALWLVALIKWVAGGDPRPALLWGTVFLLVGSGGYGVIYWLFGGAAPGSPGAVSFVVVPADYQSGRPFQAARYFPVEVTVVPVFYAPGFCGYSVTVYWGDQGGGSTSATLAGGPYTARHTYHDIGVYTVNVEVVPMFMEGNACVEDYSRRTVKTFAVEVVAPWLEYAETVKSYVESIPEEGNLVEKALIKALKAAAPRVADAFAMIVDSLARWMSFLGLSAGHAYYYYVAMPTTENFPVLRDVFTEFRTWALYLLPIVFVASLLWRGFWEWERGGDALLDAFRDLLAVAILLAGEQGVYLALEAYDLLAGTFNVVTLSVAQLGQLGALYSMIVAAGVVMSVFGIFSPGPGALGASFLLLVLAMVVVGILKWVLAAAIIAALPMLLVLWLLPPFRGVARATLSVLAGLFIFSLVAAALSALASQMVLSLTDIVEGRNVLAALAFPLLFAAATPMITNVIAGALGYAPAWGIPGLGLLRGGGSLQPPTIQAVPAAAAGAAAAAAGAGLVLMAGNRPVSGTVLGHAPSPAVAYAPAAAPALRPLPAPAAAPATAPAPVAGIPAQAARPEIREAPTGIRARLREMAEVARGRLDVDVSQATPREKAAYYAARAAGRLGSRVAQELRAFDSELARRIGVTPVRATERAARATIKAGQLGYKAAKWTVPYIKEYGGRAAAYVYTGLRKATAIKRQSFDKAAVS